MGLIVWASKVLWRMKQLEVDLRSYTVVVVKKMKNVVYQMCTLYTLLD